MEQERVTFANMDNWKGGSNKYGLTFSQIILQHIQRCVVNGSTEFYGGFWNETTTGNHTTSTYIPNSRDAFTNGVKMLRALLLGYFDAEIIESDKKIFGELKKLKERFHERTDKTDKQSRKEFEAEKVDLFIRLFEELIKLSKRLDFFEEAEGEIEQI